MTTSRHLRSLTRTASAEFAPLHLEFLGWAADSPAVADLDPEELWDDAVFLVSMADEHAGLARLSGWSLQVVATVADLLAATGHDETIACLPSLLPLLAFLAETGRWTTTAEDLDEIGERVLTVLADAAPEAALLAALDAVGEADPDAEAAALAAMPLILHTQALVTWVGARRPVTGTGALRRADIAGAAAAVGVDLGGLGVTSMWAAPHLPDVWVAAVETGALDVGRSSVTATPRGQELADGAAAPARALLQTYLTRLLTAPGERPWLPSPAHVVLPVLASALAAEREGTPLPATVLDVGTPVALFDSAGDELAELLGNGYNNAAFTEYVLTPARSLMDRLCADGVVEMGESLRVRPGLEALVGELASQLLIRALDGGAGDGDEVVVEGPATQRYQLRIDLVGAKPPVWRRVEVDPRLSLGDLHDVIQAAFGWDDVHLHAFTSRGLGGREVRYSCHDLSEPLGIGQEVEEHGVRIADVLTGSVRRLDYTYDFGDDWEHRITLEAVEPAGGEPLPRCTAGAGADPAEDSGGAWGWAGMADVANNPDDPDNQQIREWLGLATGQKLDLTAFDLDGAAERVADLR